MPPENPDRHTEPEVFLTETGLAQRWRVKLRTLQRWRRAGRAPAHLAIGRTVIYPLDAIEAFEAERLRPGGTPA